MGDQPSERQSWLFGGYRSWTMWPRRWCMVRDSRSGFSRPTEMSAASRAWNTWNAGPLASISSGPVANAGPPRLCKGQRQGPPDGPASVFCLITTTTWGQGEISRKLFAISSGPDLENLILVSIIRSTAKQSWSWVKASAFRRHHMTPSHSFLFLSFFLRFSWSWQETSD